MKKTRWLASSLSLRLKAGFGCILALLVCLAGLGLHAQSRGGADLDRLVKTNTVRQGVASELMINIGRMATEVRNIALLTSLDLIDKAGQELAPGHGPGHAAVEGRLPLHRPSLPAPGTANRWRFTCWPVTVSPART